MEQRGARDGAQPATHPGKPPASSSPLSSAIHPSSASATSEGSSSHSDSTRQASGSNSHGQRTSSTPSSSVWLTPDDPKELVDPFNAMSMTEAIPVTTPPEPVTTPSASVGACTPSSATPSGTSSSEAHDLLGPLPQSQYAADVAADRAEQRASSSRNKLPARLPLPSPPASWGMSELISGSPYHTGGDSYFAPMYSDSPPLARSGSQSRRTPPYSPFRSYYGDTGRHQRAGSIDPRPDSDSSTPRPASDVSPSPSKNSRKSPRVRNTGPVLAPHGSFTSVKVRTPTGSTQSSVASAASDSQLYMGPVRTPDDIAPAELEALKRAAEKGDQLAMYRLGWRPDTPHDRRYVLGSVEDVWGSVSP